MNRNKSLEFFHNESNHWNCAQAIQKSFQDITKLSDETIELEYRPKGGGRAENGICGALYAAKQIINDSAKAQEIEEEFCKRLGGVTCKELKQNLKVPCIQSVAIAEEILTDKLK